MSDACVCPGDILYAASYGGLDDYLFTSSVAARPSFLEVVKERGTVDCPASSSIWVDFSLDTETVIDGLDEYDAYGYEIAVAKRYCYKRFCEKVFGYFGMTEVFGFLYRLFSDGRDDVPPDEYDKCYAGFIDSMLADVRFVVCTRYTDTVDTTTSGYDGPLNATSDRVFTSTPTPMEYEDDDGSTYIERRIREEEENQLIAATRLDLLKSDSRKRREVDYEKDTAVPPTRELPPANVSDALSAPGSVRHAEFTEDGGYYYEEYPNGPLSAARAPDTSLQDEMANSELNRSSTMAVVPEEEEHAVFTSTDPFDRVPEAVFYNFDGRGVLNRATPPATLKVTGLTRVLPVSSDRSGGGYILYAVRYDDGELTFTATDVENPYYSSTGKRGRILLDATSFLKAILDIRGSPEASAKFVNEKDLDLFNFQLAVIGVPVSKSAERIFLTLERT